LFPRPGRNEGSGSRIQLTGDPYRDSGKGKHMDQQLKRLMKDLGEAINESLADSDQISDVVSRIKDGGYDIFLVLEATIGLTKQGEKGGESETTSVTMRTNSSLTLDDQDQKFLKSLRIKIEDLE
jgi:hypothetical protein